MKAIRQRKAWAPTRIGDVIIQRQFTLKNRRKKTFLLEIGRPVKDPTTRKNSPWCCPIQITGMGVREFSYAYGEDSLQSMTLGLYLSLTLLRTFSMARKIEIQWLGPELPLIYDWWDLKA